MVLAILMLTLNSVAGTAGPILISKALDLVKKDSSLRVLLLLWPWTCFCWAFSLGDSTYIRQVFSARVVGDVVLQSARGCVRFGRSQRPVLF